MNFKRVSGFLLFFCFLQIGFVCKIEAAYARYYDIVQDAINALTLDEGTTILGLFSNDTASGEIRSQLQMELQMWMAEHGSSDQVENTYNASESGKIFCVAFSIGTFSLPVLSCFGYTSFPGSMAWAAVCGSMSAGMALMLAKKSKISLNNIKRFSRICGLMKHLAR